MIVGTAGHIDHGKTALVRALTGVDPDRLPEEQARGITLDLGYAYHPLPNRTVLGFVDVPGHERLVHTMVAGATGIDQVLLVVAADDGPMPQTREHLRILELLGLSRGTVALTKIDRVSPERCQAARKEIEALLAGTCLAGSPLFAVNSLTGDGVAALRRHLETTAEREPPPADSGRFRLAVDRAFTLPGTGTIVTGTAYSGQVQEGDRLLLAPRGLQVRVRGLRVQGQPADRGRAGQRCALNLVAADLHHRDIHRGDWVLDPALNFPSDRFAVEVRLADPDGEPVRHWTPLHLHLGAAHAMARLALLEGDQLAPGRQSLAELVLDRRIAVLNGDRFILRDQSARHTLGGGRILDLSPPQRGRRRPERLAWLGAFTGRDPIEAAALVLPQATQGIDLDLFVRQWNLGARQAEALARMPDSRLIPTGGGPVVFAPPVWEQWRTRILAAVAQEQERNPDWLGPDRERLRRVAAPALARPLLARLVDELIDEGHLVRTGTWLHLPNHCLRLEPQDEPVWQAQLRPLLDETPFQPPRVRDLARLLDLDEGRVRKIMKRLVGMGELFQVAHDHFFTRDAVERLAVIVRHLSETDSAALAAPFRDMIGTGRKVAIHILEFFDRMGYTRRIGDQHRVFRDSLLDFGQGGRENQ